jgi:site-specific DNA recombinase
LSTSLTPPLRPRDGHTLRVLGVARISTLNQDERSLDDQEALLRRWLDRHHGRAYSLQMVSSQGSGERLDRAESIELSALVESRRFDLVLSEDLGRIFRRMHAYLFCEACEDAGTRLVAINDNVDTATGAWRIAAIFQAFKHESSNRDTSERIKRTLGNRFIHGGVFQVPVYGYIKGPGAEGDKDVRKDPAAAAVYDEWFTRLENSASYSEVADWLNARGVPVGPYCRGPRWTGRMVRRVTFNPVLKGLRERNRRKTVRNNRSGQHVSVPAPPEELLTRECPHLAFIEPDRYDRVLRLLRRRHRDCARGRAAGAADGRAGVAKRRTVWPGQHVRCAVCRGLYYWGGHGQASRLMCSGSRDHRCWNAATFDGYDAARRLRAAVLEEVERLPGYGDTLAERVRAAADGLAGSRAAREREARDRLARADLQLRRVADAVADVGLDDGLRQKRAAVLAEREAALARLDELRIEAAGPAALPSVEDLKAVAREEFEKYDAGGAEFGRLMADLIPSLEVIPHRLLDGGAVVLRARLRLCLAQLAGPSGRAPAVVAHLTREVVVDLFDRPQRARLLWQVVALRAAGRTERQAAQELGITVTAAQRAAALARLMEERGTDDPYERLTAPPQDAKFRRHLHPRYRFSPLDGREV